MRRAGKSSVALDEEIEVAVGGRNENVIGSRRMALRSGMNEVRLLVDAPPASVTVDPRITRTDRNPMDNFKRF